MSDLSDFYLFMEQQNKILEIVDWVELHPIKKHLSESLFHFDYLFYNAAKAMIKN